MFLLDLILFLRPDQQAFSAQHPPLPDYFSDVSTTTTARGLYVRRPSSPPCRGQGTHFNRGSMRDIIIINGKPPLGMPVRKEE